MSNSPAQRTANLDLHARLQAAILKADPKLKHGNNASALRNSKSVTKRLAA